MATTIISAMFLLDDNLLCIQGAIPPKPIMHIVYSPYFHKIYKSPPHFRSIYVLLLNLCFFGFPYFDHDAFTHHALHVLNALCASESRLHSSNNVADEFTL